MAKQGRSQGGKFAPKSDEPRIVRSVRLTDFAWNRLGEVANLQGITRADLLEKLVRQEWQGQLALFPDEALKADLNREVITTSTRKTGTELAHRLNVSSAALTNWLKSGKFSERSRTRDPDGIPWERESEESRMYRPIL